MKSRVVEKYNNDYKNITKSKKENKIYFQDKESDEKIAGFTEILKNILKIDKKMTSSSTFTDKSGNLMKTSSNNSINENNELFNSL